jgi:hypothetical protein
MPKRNENPFAKISDAWIGDPTLYEEGGISPDSNRSVMRTLFESAIDEEHPLSVEEFGREFENMRGSLKGEDLAEAEQMMRVFRHPTRKKSDLTYEGVPLFDSDSYRRDDPSPDDIYYTTSARLDEEVHDLEVGDYVVVYNSLPGHTDLLGMEGYVEEADNAAEEYLVDFGQSKEVLRRIEIELMYEVHHRSAEFESPEYVQDEIPEHEEEAPEAPEEDLYGGDRWR